MFVLAGGLLGLIVLLAALQYRWLGQISEAERRRMSATAQTSAAGFAEDFDRELNRAYLLFQIGIAANDDSVPAQLSARYDRWQATARFPRMIKDVYLVTTSGGSTTFKRLNAQTRFVEPADWPEALAPIRAQLGGGPVASVWPDAPALVVASPFLFVSRLSDRPGAQQMETPPVPTEMSYAVLHLDAAYIRGEILPSLAQHHFQGATGGFEYELAVVPTAGSGTVYRSVDGFTPNADTKADATADLFHLRVQDFGPLAAEISRFAFFTATAGPGGRARGEETAARTQTVIRHLGGPVHGTATAQAGGPVSIFITQTGRSGASATLPDRLYTTTASAATRVGLASSPHWRLLVKHPSGSLERAVGSVRRRNLLVSTGILGILGVSVAFLIVSTRRAHDLARRQLEFVATVSHELRTPLAVIRSAADNLADGVVGDEARVRQYGQLVRREGLRLTELVEQVLEFAGLQSGRETARHPVTVDAVLREAAAAAQSAAEAAGVRIELSIADGLPAVSGDEAALRRAFVNLIGNAVKYGAAAGWVGVRASLAAGRVEIAVSDRGIGIASSEQEKIFEPFYRAPDVVAAQIQGAGLGLSLVKRIVDAHGGTIAVTSAPGEGSTFTVTLPALSGDAAGDTRSVGETAAQPL